MTKIRNELGIMPLFTLRPFFSKVLNIGKFEFRYYFGFRISCFGFTVYPG